MGVSIVSTVGISVQVHNTAVEYAIIILLLKDFGM